MKKSLIKIILYSVLSCGALTSCLQDRGQTTAASTQASWFTGVSTAQNLGGYPAAVKISWNAADTAVTSYRIYSLEYSETSKNNQWTLIDEVSSDQLSYVHSNLSSGQIYSYMVRAVDSEDKEDSNNKQVSTVAFDGIASVRITGTSTATVTLNTSTGSFDEVRVYAQPVRSGGIKSLMATIKGNVSSIDISGLQSGVKYKFSVAAYMSYLSAEDGNNVYLEGKTHSESFGSGATSDSNYAYKGVLNVQAFGDAPNAPAAPKMRVVKLTWPSFSNASSSTRYQVTRASTAYSPDPSTTIACTSSTDSSCVVACSNSGSGPQTCEDWAVAAAPKTYHYTISLKKTDPVSGEQYAEELPVNNASDFYVRVSIPSDYMVLVQRDAANYEMCMTMGQTPNPRKHQRCSYGGIAATPYNSGPGKPALSFDSGYYDFGYNLFVDRYKLACNWTRPTESNACGSNGCVGITTASSFPSTSVTDLTFFNLNRYEAYNCFYKTSSGWVTVDTLTDPEKIRRATTIDPGPDGNKHNPVIGGMSQETAYNLCNAQTSAYGSKRLLRRREYVHAAAFAMIPGEPGAKNIIDNANLRMGTYVSGTAPWGGQLPNYYWCAGTTQLTIPTTLAELLSSSNTRSQVYDSAISEPLNRPSSSYFIGTISTSNCVSRWGSQDPVSMSSTYNANVIFSDTFIRGNSATTYPATFIPAASDFDSGVAADWGNYAFDNATGPTTGTSPGGIWNINFTSAFIPNYPRFILPLGVPLITNNSVYKSTNDLIYAGALGTNHINNWINATMVFDYSSQTRFAMFDGAGAHRFGFGLRTSAQTTRHHAWCAVEAE